MRVMLCSYLILFFTRRIRYCSLLFVTLRYCSLLFDTVRYCSSLFVDVPNCFFFLNFNRSIFNFQNLFLWPKFVVNLIAFLRTIHRSCCSDPVLIEIHVSHASAARLMRLRQETMRRMRMTAFRWTCWKAAVGTIIVTIEFNNTVCVPKNSCVSKRYVRISKGSEHCIVAIEYVSGSPRVNRCQRDVLYDVALILLLGQCRTGWAMRRRSVSEPRTTSESSLINTRLPNYATYVNNAALVCFQLIRALEWTAVVTDAVTSLTASLSVSAMTSGGQAVTVRTNAARNCWPVKMAVAVGEYKLSVSLKSFHNTIM